MLGISLYNTLWILLLAYLARFFALALRTVVAALTQLDPALEEAARNAGARGIRRLFTIVLPMIAPAIGAWRAMSATASRCAGYPPAQRTDRVAEALATVGLSGFERRRVQNLSGGQRQRVALARCLAMKPRLLLLDEPLANLDAHLREAMVEEFRRLHHATGASIVYVTHDQAEAMALADRIAVMSAGQLLQIGAPQQLWREPADATVARFLGRGQIVPVELTEPGLQARARLFGHEVSLRAPSGLAQGAALACLRRRDITPGADGFAAKVLDCRQLGDRYLLTVSPETATDIHLHCELDTAPERSTLRMTVSDGWVLPPDTGVG